MFLSTLCRSIAAALLLICAVSGCRIDREKDHAARTWSQYVAARDGVKLAVDVWLPRRKPHERLPTAVQMTRYQRAYERPAGEPDTNHDEAARWTQAGYAFVVIDARGSGASFGTRSSELSPREIADYGDVIDWIAAQPWSNDRVGAFGTSYSGDTAELVTALRNPHVKAAGLLFNDFDLYEDTVVPGGLLNAVFASHWSLQNDVFDAVPGAVEALASLLGMPAEDLRPLVPVVKPVDGADGPSLRQAAIAEHAGNVRLFPHIMELAFRDQPITPDGPTLESLSAYPQQREIESSNVPLLVLASWLDAGTARGALARFNTFSNAQEVYIGSWSHGGGSSADPFAAADRLARPGPAAQQRWLIEFFDRYVKNAEPARPRKVLHYATLGDDRWRETDRWPLAGTAPQTFYLQAEGALTGTPATAGSGADVYRVDLSASTGANNRWIGQATGNDTVYDERSAEDRKLLVYQTQPLASAMRIAGMPVVHLYLSVDRDDAPLFVYLEDVAPDGRVTYVTEGQLRLLDRAVASDNPAYRAGRVPRSFASAAAQPMPPGETAEIALDLLPTSARIAAGHSLRIAIAGADAHTFLPPPGDTPPTFTIQRNTQYASRVEVPVVADDH